MNKTVEGTRGKAVKRTKHHLIRKYIVILLFIVFLPAPIWCLVEENRKYFYAGFDWMKITAEVQSEVSLPKDTVLSERGEENGYQEYAQRYIEMLSTQQIDYPFLRWEKLYEVHIKHCEALKYTDECAQAVYNPEKNWIIIWENSPNENLEINLLLIREALLDCLTYNPKCNDLLKFGIKKVLANPYEMNGIPLEHPEEYKEMYKLGEWEFNILSKFLDKKHIIFLWYQGYLESIVNDYTGGKYYSKLQIALQNVAVGESEKKYLRIAQDILVHFAKAYVEREKLSTEKLEETKNILLLKEDYFLKLLS